MEPLIFVGIYYALMSLIAFCVYKKDKAAAENGEWRTSECQLHFWGLLGGWPGALVAMLLLSHKTRKIAFQIAFWLMALANLFILQLTLKHFGLITSVHPLVYFGVYYAVVGWLTFFVYARDKAAADRNSFGEERTSECQLHFWGLLGGWPGALVAMLSLSHKTQKIGFQILFWFTVLANLAVLVLTLKHFGLVNIQLIPPSVSLA